MEFTPSIAQIEALLTRSTAADAALLAREYLADYCPWTAVALCEAARHLGLVDPALTLLLADSHFRAGRAPDALVVLDGLLHEHPEHLAAQCLRGRVLATLDRRSAAQEALLRVVAEYPDYPGALATLSTVTFPGPGYRAVIARLHDLLRPTSYLEIGVETGETLAIADAARRAVGVDPHPEKVVVDTPPNVRLYASTSDDFFARETRDSVFDGRAVDLAFIDGMHWFEYVLRDFANVEPWCTPDSTILLHDCLPVAEIAARRERASTFWVGDTWKALECLMEYRPDLRIHIIPAAPSGLAIVQRLDPSSTVLLDHIDEICRRHADRAYSHQPVDWPTIYPVVRNDDEGIRHAAGVERAIVGG